MKEHPGSGLLIVIDGIDGAGKTTQVNCLARLLRAAGETVLVSKEPTDGPDGARIRASAITGRLPVNEELELLIADRKEHLSAKVRPALERGDIVILDRYLYSTIAYQGARLGSAAGIEERVRRNAVCPDMVAIMDIDPRVAALRIADRDGEPNEFESLSEQVKVRKFFKELCVKDPLLIEIDGNNSVSQISKVICDTLVSGPLKARRCSKSYGCDDPLHCVGRIQNTCGWFQLKQKLIELTPS